MADRSWVARAAIAAAVVIAVVVGSLVLWTAGGGDGSDETAEVQAADAAPTEVANEADPTGRTATSPTPTVAAAEETPVEEPPADEVPSEETLVGEDPAEEDPADPVEQTPGGSVLAATDLCGGWAEFTDAFLQMMGGDFGGEPDDPEAVHAYFQAAMQDLAALSPTDELRDAHLTLSTATLEEFTGQTADIEPRLDAAFSLLDEELTRLCPAPG